LQTVAFDSLDTRNNPCGTLCVCVCVCVWEGGLDLKIPSNVYAQPTNSNETQKEGLWESNDVLETLSAYVLSLVDRLVAHVALGTRCPAVFKPAVADGYQKGVEGIGPHNIDHTQPCRVTRT